MKIRMLVSQVGPETVREPGEEYDISDEEAKRLIEAGLAEPVRARKVERATRDAREKAVSR